MKVFRSFISPLSPLFISCLFGFMSSPPIQYSISLLALHPHMFALCDPPLLLFSTILLVARFCLCPCSMYPSVRRAYTYLNCV